MMFGVCMSVVNIVHFKRYSNLFFEFLPQLIFLVALFFYMAFLMFAKWVLYDPISEELRFKPGCAPSVLNTFINMLLFKHSKMEEGCHEYMFEGQEILQWCLVLIALLCIPIMLFGKPLYTKLCLGKKEKYGSKAYSNGDASQDIELQNVPTMSQTAASTEQDHENDFGELMIHQSIHTIEYVLSTISHTASYLRLWALSLAHSQLSEVLWSRVLRMGLRANEDNYIKSIVLFFTFAAWAFFTICILVLMEGLSAFLHTLRLHWMEFMSKFYRGEGYIFQPFYFKTILDTEDAEE